MSADLIELEMLVKKLRGHIWQDGDGFRLCIPNAEVGNLAAALSSRATPSDERAAFEARFSTLDHSTTKDAWGGPMHVYPIVGALWDGWQARASLAATQAPAAEPPDLESLETGEADARDMDLLDTSRSPGD